MKNDNGIIDLEQPAENEITVLMVDDQAMICEVVRRMLVTEKDIDFHFCTSPTQAITKAIEVCPTVILQDLTMPDIDGLTMVKYFRAEPKTRNIPLIVLSSEENAEVKAKAFAYGANDYLIKLPDSVELIARIRYHSGAYISMQERNEAFYSVLESQKELLESEARYRELFFHMSSGVVVLSPLADGSDFTVVDINHAAEKMEGINKEQDSGKRLTEVMTRVKKAGLLEAIQKVSQTGNSISLTTSYANDSIWFVNFIYQLESGEVVLIYDDISLRKKTELALRKANEVLGPILAGISAIDEIKKRLSEPDARSIRNDSTVALQKLSDCIEHIAALSTALQPVAGILNKGGKNE